MLALAVPTAAWADSPPLITGEPEVTEEAPLPAPDVEWRDTLDAELRLHTRGWAIAAAGTGLLQASFLLMQPARVPFALQLSIANTLLWLPALSTLIVMAGTRQLLTSTWDARTFERELRRASSIFGIVSLSLLTVSLPLAVYAGLFDASISVAVLGAQISLLFISATCSVLAQRVAVHSWVRPRQATRIQVMPGPAGVVVLF
jgi:hypothetical protein